jgi:hypothetical protein
MGADMLNDPFRGCDAHHIDYTTIVFIPRYIHRMASSHDRYEHRLHVIMLIEEFEEYQPPPAEAGGLKE